MEKLERVLQAELESLESQLTYLINCRHTEEIELQKDIIKAMIISKHAGIQACQEPESPMVKPDLFTLEVFNRRLKRLEEMWISGK